jgi:hypothetical protein
MFVCLWTLGMNLMTEIWECLSNTNFNVLCNHCCRGKAISIAYCEFVSVALVIQHAKRMRRIILSSVACLAVPYFSTLSHKRHDFRGKNLLNIKCVFWFCLQILYEILLILRRIERDIIINVHRSSCKVSVIVVRFQWKFVSTDSRKILIYQILWKSIQWEPSCSMHEYY